MQPPPNVNQMYAGLGIHNLTAARRRRSRTNREPEPNLDRRLLVYLRFMDTLGYRVRGAEAADRATVEFQLNSAVWLPAVCAVGCDLLRVQIECGVLTLDRGFCILVA